MCKLRVQKSSDTFLRNGVAAVDEWYRYRIVAYLFTSSSPLPPRELKCPPVSELRFHLRVWPCGYGSPVIKVLGRGWLVNISSPVPLKFRLGEEGCQLRCHPCHLTMVQNLDVCRQKLSCSLTARR
ncbi:hypothetical protein TNCV_742061 [Trichonephila clavipes]|nr:hypothetical protein TNCV_742061 [Trichonephila clavipes]